MTVLPGCACSCCGATGPLITTADIPSTQSFAQFLNGTREFKPANTLTPYRFVGSAFTAVGSSIAVAGTLSFDGFVGDSVTFLANVRTLPGGRLTITVPGGTVSFAQQLAATSTSPVWFPIEFGVVNTGGRLLSVNGSQIETTGAYQLDFRLEPELFVTQLNDDDQLITIRHRSAPELDKFYFLRGVAAPLQDPEAAWLLSTECRVVVERDGEVVLDQVRPTEAQLTSAYAARGSYVQTKFFANSFDLLPPSVPRAPRPSRLIQTSRVDNDPPVIGILPWNDYHFSLDEERPLIGFCTKPSLSQSNGVFLEDESLPGAAVRPSTASPNPSRSSWISVSAEVGTHPVTGGTIRELRAVSSTLLRDFANLLPVTFPAIRFVEHPLQAGEKRMALPTIRHPGLETRELFRPRSQSERVSTVTIAFTQPIRFDDSGRNAQLTFTVNGMEVAGTTWEWDAERLEATATIPTGDQLPGTFCVFEFDPNGAFISDDDDSIPTYMAVRTSWLMQKPYPQLIPTTRRSVVIGASTSIARVADTPTQTAPLLVGLGSNVSCERIAPDLGRVGIVQARKGSDVFAPHVASGEDPPPDCSYFGLTTTIHPSPPRNLSCPMPRITEPHNSAFLHGGGAGDVVLQLLQAPSGNTALINYGPITFRRVIGGRTMAPNTWALDAGSNVGFLTAQRRVTQYDYLASAFPWELLLDVRAYFTSPSAVGIVARVFVIDSDQESLGTFEYTEPTPPGGPVWRWRVTL
jgi:hypothetical protein